MNPNPSGAARREALAEARSRRHEPGFVFLDSSLPRPGAVSLVGSFPVDVVEGECWGKLQKWIYGISTSRGKEFTRGAAVGWVGFDGRWRFGLYDHLKAFPADLADSSDEDAEEPAAAPIDFRPQMTRDTFERMVSKAKDYIAAGDIYQVCLSHPFRACTSADPWMFYERLRRISPAPQSAFLSLGGTTVASSSPELFLDFNGRLVETRPIKGTRPRRADQEADWSKIRELATSPKEMAELVMITDMERNDLGSVCEYGSVKVPELLALERYNQVFHLVSRVRGRLRDDVGPVEALQACFPGGSISGAPKKRALEIISELEPHPRGIYTGAIGYFGFDGRSSFSIAIRTAVFEEGMASFHVGAGIVADSDPHREWLETWDKAAGLLDAAGCRRTKGDR
jgi:para-aminobenzoate synthetase component 1